MEISQHGNNLNILITSGSNPHHEWMSLASWYSIYQNLPAANVAICCSREQIENTRLFPWTSKAKVLCFKHENLGKHLKSPTFNKLYSVYVALKNQILPQPLLVIDYDHVCLKGFSEKTLQVLNNTDFGMNSEDWYDERLGSVWFIKNCTLKMIEDAIDAFKVLNVRYSQRHLLELALCEKLGDPQTIPEICGGGKDDFTTFAHISDNFFLFNKDEWMSTKKTPPFAITIKLLEKLKNTPAGQNEIKVIDLWKKIANIYDTIKW